MQDNDIVAIKKMKQKYHNWDECLQLKEIKSLRKLQHPNLIRLQEVLRLNDELYLVFDFLEYNLFQVYNNAKEKGRKFTENEIKYA
jgi:protein kinase